MKESGKHLDFPTADSPAVPGLRVDPESEEMGTHRGGRV